MNKQKEEKSKTIALKIDRKLLATALDLASFETSMDKIYKGHPFYDLLKDILKQIPKKKNAKK